MKRFFQVLVLSLLTSAVANAGTTLSISNLSETSFHPGDSITFDVTLTGVTAATDFYGYQLKLFLQSSGVAATDPASNGPFYFSGPGATGPDVPNLATDYVLGSNGTNWFANVATDGPKLVSLTMGDWMFNKFPAVATPYLPPGTLISKVTIQTTAAMTSNLSLFFGTDPNTETFLVDSTPNTPPVDGFSNTITNAVQLTAILPPPSTVPEPATLISALASIVVVSGFRYRRNLVRA